MLIGPEEALDIFEQRGTVESVGGSSVPLVAIDLRLIPRSFVRDDGDQRLRAAMIAGPWVNVAIVGPDLDPTFAPLADAADVLIGEHTGADAVVDVADAAQALAELRSCIEASPAAAVALVQLLRMSHDLSVEQALHAESVTYGLLQTGETFTRWLGGRGPIAAHIDDGPAVILQRTDSLLTITLNRPDRRNALNVAMRDHLADAIALLDDDHSIDGAILQGAGSNFCAGGDLDEFGSTPSPAIGHRVRTLRSLPRLMHRVSGRIRVHVHGSCVGAGIELPAFAHSVIASPDATFRLPEVGFGLVPGAGGTVSISRRCGRHRTAWLALTGATIDAKTARSWQLIDRIDPAVSGRQSRMRE